MKGLSFPDLDLSLQLAEWLAIHIALGVARCCSGLTGYTGSAGSTFKLVLSCNDPRITLYILSIHPNMRKVLEGFKAQHGDKIEVRNTDFFLLKTV